MDVRSVVVKWGYVPAATNDFAPAGDYARGRAAYEARVKEMLEAELARMDPPLTLAALRDRVAKGHIGPELIALGQDGAVHLPVRRLLRIASGAWVTDREAYDAQLDRRQYVSDPSFGTLVAPPLAPGEIAAYLEGLSPADVDALEAEPVAGLYGQRALATPALVGLLVRELGLMRRLAQLPLRDGGLHGVQGLLHQRAQRIVLLQLGELLRQDVGVGNLLLEEDGPPVEHPHLEGGVIDAKVLGLEVILLPGMLEHAVHPDDHARTARHAEPESSVSLCLCGVLAVVRCRTRMR